MLSKAEKDKLVMTHQGLVISEAKKRVTSQVEFLDLVQEGNMGLIMALEKYDPGRPTKFSTMAMWYVRKMMKRAVMNYRIVHVPQGVQIKQNKINRLANRVYVRTGTQLARRYSSVPGTSSVGDGHNFSDESSSDYIETTYIKQLGQTVNEAAQFMSDRQLEVLRLRAQGKEPTEISKIFGCTPQRITQVYNKAVKLIRSMSSHMSQAS